MYKYNNKYKRKCRREARYNGEEIEFVITKGTNVYVYGK